MREIASVFICGECRTVFEAEKGDSFNSPDCPKCKGKISNWTVASELVDCQEDREALELIVRHSECEVVDEVAQIMGIGHGMTKVREDESTLNALREYAETA